MSLKNKNGGYNFVNSKSLFVLKIITMSFAILAFIVVTTAMLTRWIMELHQSIKESHTKIARAAARMDKFRKSRIKHILKQRKQQLKEEKQNKNRVNHESSGSDGGELCEIDEIGDIIDYSESESDGLSESERAVSSFDNELSDIMLGETEL
jgi:hypothetical protein